MATSKSVEIQQHIIEILEQESWLSSQEIFMKLPNRNLVEKYTFHNAMRLLVNRGRLRIKTPEGNVARYCLVEKDESILSNRREMDVSGLPWVKMPRTPEARQQTITILNSVLKHPIASQTYHPETIAFFETNIKHIEALEKMK